MRSPDFTAALLPERAIIQVGGADARDFLHNLLTADIAALDAGEATYAALLSPQGKILFDLFVYSDGLSFFVDCASSQKPGLLKRLGMYKLRADVIFREASDLEIGVSPAEPIHALRYPDPRCADLGWRMIVPEGRLKAAPGYHGTRISLGLADTDADLGSGEFFPHEANLDQLGGVSFTKGCYIGQEVVSRMEHRGTARNRILPVKLDGQAAAKGAEIRSGSKTIGTLLSSCGSIALALIRLDRLAEAGAPLLTESVSVQVLKPRWVRYDVPNARIVA